jgi:hypothetical protein
MTGQHQAQGTLRAVNPGNHIAHHVGLHLIRNGGEFLPDYPLRRLLETRWARRFHQRLEKSKILVIQLIAPG